MTWRKGPFPIFTLACWLFGTSSDSANSERMRHVAMSVVYSVHRTCTLLCTVAMTARSAASSRCWDTSGSRVRVARNVAAAANTAAPGEHRSSADDANAIAMA